MPDRSPLTPQRLQIHLEVCCHAEVAGSVQITGHPEAGPFGVKLTGTALLIDVGRSVANGQLLR